MKKTPLMLFQTAVTVMMTALLSIFPGCYSFHSGKLPISTVSVPAATNATSDYRLTDVVTKSVISALMKNGSIGLVESGKAEGQLLIVIESYLREPYRYSSQEVVSEYKVTINASARINDDKGKDIWKGEKLTAWGSYYPSMQEELVGIQQAADKLAEEIVRRAFEAW